MLGPMWVGVLGPTQARLGADGAEIDLGAPKPRMIVASLAMAAGRAVSADALVDRLWGDEPPRGASGTLQAYIAGLRRLIEPDRAPRARPTVLVTETAGYALKVDSADMDARAFEQRVEQARASIGPLASSYLPDASAVSDAVLAKAAGDLASALTLWRGEAYADLGDHPDAVVERQRLGEQRLLATEDLVVVRMARGEHAAVSAELESLTVRYPLRERLWALRAVALSRSGRQAEALNVLTLLRRTLDEELGLEPTASLRDLQTSILRQDPSLDLPASPVVAAPRRRSRSDGLPVLPDWPMFGRTESLQALVDRLDLAETGTPQFTSLIGEPGIGKTRLASELGVIAADRGALVLVGRCSQDDGAPALWPWTSVLGELGASLPELSRSGGDPDAEQFLAWDAICRHVTDAAADRLVVLGLDDLHWADHSSLRVLRHLCDVAQVGRLLVLATWRPTPPPTGTLAEVADAFARRHGLRLELAGLSTAEAADVVRAVGDIGLGPEDMESLRGRTEGNPFFLVEYARLIGQQGTRATEELPQAVADVVHRRVEQLPSDTRTLLALASVVGRDFDLTVLAATAELDELAALDRLEPAFAAGLVRDVGGDQFRFSHALVRDGVYAELAPSRRARVHARVAASIEANARAAARTSEIARHWGLAGPSNNGRAWAAASLAAEAAVRVHAYDEAAMWLSEAVEQQMQDLEATATQRYELLLRLGDAFRWSGHFTGLSTATQQAMDTAVEMGDPELVVRAAEANVTGALWQPRDYGNVNQDVVRTLRATLADLPPDDSQLHCRLLVVLAAELYYAPGVLEREAFAEQALAIARRLGDQRLLLHTVSLVSLAIWRASTAEQRLVLADEMVTLARDLGDIEAEVGGLTMRAGVHAELGHVEAMWADAELARPTAIEQNQHYAWLVLDTMRLPWLAMSGLWEEVDRTTVEVLGLGSRMVLPQKDDGLRGALLISALWRGGSDEATATMMRQLTAETGMPVSAPAIVFFLRRGDLSTARALYEGAPIDLDHDNWLSPLVWAFAGEVALAFGDAPLGAQVYALLSPLRGRPAVGGTGGAVGPVDAYLALAAASTGERELAAGHADAALELCASWKIPLTAQWLREQRDLHGF